MIDLINGFTKQAPAGAAASSKNGLDAAGEPGRNSAKPGLTFGETFSDTLKAKTESPKQQPVKQSPPVSKKKFQGGSAEETAAMAETASGSAQAAQAETNPREALEDTQTYESVGMDAQTAGDIQPAYVLDIADTAPGAEDNTGTETPASAFADILAALPETEDAPVEQSRAVTGRDAVTAQAHEALEQMTTDTESSDGTAAPRNDDAMGHIMNMRVKHSAHIENADTPDTVAAPDAAAIQAEEAGKTGEDTGEQSSLSDDGKEAAAPGETRAAAAAVPNKDENADTDNAGVSGAARETAVPPQTNELKPAVNTAQETPEGPQNAFQARNVINQIVQASAMSRQDGTSRLEIQLKPEFLGKLSIVLTNSNEGVNAQIKAGSDTTRNMLLNNLPELQVSLKNMGIDMKNIEITDNQTGWDFTKSGGQPNQDARQSDKHSDREQTIRKIRNSMSIPMTPAAASYGMAVRNAYIRDDDVSVEFLA